MTRRAKAGLVLGGYALAIVAAIVTGWAYDLYLDSLPEDTSGGMYAFGVLLAMVAAFLAVAFVPTALWAWFIVQGFRRRRGARASLASGS